MKKILLNSILLCFLIFVVAVNSHALEVSLNPSTQTIGIGDTALVELNISGLEDGAAPSLGAFLVEITFDESILSFDSVVYGAFLGDTDPSAFETDIFTTTGAGFISLDEGSLLWDDELDALQSDSFTLAILSFIGLSGGTSSLGFGDVDLADAEFPSNSLFSDLVTASITVDSGSSQVVPEPATISLFIVGLLGFAGLRRHFNKK